MDIKTGAWKLWNMLNNGIPEQSRKTSEEKAELIRQLRAEALRRSKKLEALVAKMRKEGISENMIAETAANYSGNEY